jgi:hypothetical protein
MAQVNKVEGRIEKPVADAQPFQKAANGLHEPMTLKIDFSIVTPPLPGRLTSHKNWFK